jgi:hypothetical protein
MMRRRIYWLVPDVDSARRMTDDLLLARIDQGHIHCVGCEGSDLSGLHEANILQTSDIIHAAQQGLVIGGGIGFLAGLVAAMYPIFGEGPEWGLVGVLAVLGGAIGAWASSMIGSSVPNSRLKRFEEALRQGQILMMVDVPRYRVKEIETMLQEKHPEAHLEGEEPAIPAFP